MIQVRVRFFASLRERFECAARDLEAPESCTVAEIWAQVSGGVPVPDNLLCARNQDYVELNARVGDGDEIAFFPPVTGG